MKKNVYNIVWADDDIDVLYDDLMERRFRENDFVLYGKAYTADELEKIIEADTNKIDAVIIDANFTESNKLVDSERNFSGLDYCRLIAKRFNQLPFFVSLLFFVYFSLSFNTLTLASIFSIFLVFSINSC